MSAPFRRSRRVARQARVGAAFLASKMLRRDQRETARSVTKSLGKMKGVTMKLGQAESYQNSKLSEPWQEALAALQQDAPSMSARAAAKVVEAELGQPPDKLFAIWTPTPMAAASVGQVHRALTPDGRAVAVKVQFPQAEDAFRSDVQNVSTVVRTAARDKLGPGGKKIDHGILSSLFSEFEERLVQEVDYHREADNQELIGAAFVDHPKIHVPTVYRDLSARRVLTTQLAEGVRFQEAQGWSQQQRDAAGETLFRFHFSCILDLGTYNMDPHPGNYLFRPNGAVSFLDFGAVDDTVDAFVEWLAAAFTGGAGSAWDRAPAWLAEQLADEGPRPLSMPSSLRPQARPAEAPGSTPLPVPSTLYGLQAVLARLGSECNWSAIVRDIGGW